MAAYICEHCGYRKDFAVSEQIIGSSMMNGAPVCDNCNQTMTVEMISTTKEIQT